MSPWPPAHANPHACTAVTERSVQPPKATRTGSPGGEPTPSAKLCAASPFLLPRSADGAATLRRISPCPHPSAEPETRPPLNSPLTWQRRHRRCPTPLNAHQESSTAEPPPLRPLRPATATHLQSGRERLPGAQGRAALAAADLPTSLETPFAHAAL